jgi:DNA-binding transcriptional MocR family regulator
MSTLYDEVVSKIMKLIETEVLKPGAKLPSLRQLKQNLKVSSSTVLHAYSILEGKGLIESRPQSGYFVSRRTPPSTISSSNKTPSLKPSKLEVSDFISNVLLSNSRPGMISFGAALLDPKLLPIKQLNSILGTIARKGGPKSLGYNPPPGSLNLRTQLALRSLSWGCNLAPEDFITTTGALEAMKLALMAVTKPGDNVAIETPTFFGILRIMEALGLRAVEIPVHSETGLDLTHLSEVLKKTKINACVVVPNFHNPTGSSMPDKNKKSLVELLSSYKIPMIENDIYGDLFFGTKRPISLKAFDKEGLVLHCSSVSKSLAPGYRVGWIAPGKFYERVMFLKSSIAGESVLFTEEAIAHFMKSGGYDRHLKKVRKLIAVQSQKTKALVSEHFPEGTKYSEPQGGLTLWVELPEGSNTIELQERILEENITFAPGPIFSVHKKYSNFLRLNCGTNLDPKRVAALKTLGKYSS